MAIIDTLQVSKDLMKAGISQDAAEELAFQFKRNEEGFLSKKEAEEKLATKKDIEKLRSDTKIKLEEMNSTIAESKASIIKWVAAMLVAQSGIIISAILVS